MALYSPQQLGINANTTGGQFQQGGWYNGRQYWDGKLGEVNEIINPNQQGYKQQVSAEVRSQSAAAQGVSAQQFDAYLDSERKKQQQSGVQGTPSGGGSGAQNFTPFDPSSLPGVAGLGATQQPAIDLPKLYENLYNNSNIKNSQAEYDSIANEINTRLAAVNEAKAKINDNPFYSEATRTGRLRKLDEQYNDDIQALTSKQTALQNKIAMDKADIETKLNLEMKQFDINSQQAQLALSQFNTLLQAGAFDNASGEDIAAVTRSTGLSSNMIMSAVNAQKARNVQTSTMSFDDGTSQGFVVINSQTGEIISKQVIGASKPGAAKEASESEQRQYYVGLAKSSAQKGLTVSQMLSAFSGYLEPNEIYQLYQSNSKYGPDKASKRELERYGISF